MKEFIVNHISRGEERGKNQNESYEKQDLHHLDIG